MNSIIIVYELIDYYYNYEWYMPHGSWLKAQQVRVPSRPLIQWVLYPMYSLLPTGVQDLQTRSQDLSNRFQVSGILKLMFLSPGMNTLPSNRRVLGI